MSDPRQALSTENVIQLIQAVNSALGKAKSKRVRQRLTILREKLQRIGRSDAEAINSSFQESHP